MGSTGACMVILLCLTVGSLPLLSFHSFLFLPFHFLPLLVLTKLFRVQVWKVSNSYEFHSIDGWPSGQYVLKSQLAHPVHRKGCSKSCQTVAGEQKRGVVREVALREEGGVESIAPLEWLNMQKNNFCCLWKNLFSYFHLSKNYASHLS